MTWLDVVRARSFAHLYMTKPTSEPLPPHLVWQAPFVLASPDASFEELEERVLLAGELWLVNYDLRPHRELIIAHATEPWFMGFQRAERPDEGHIKIGPLARRVLAPTNATPLFGLPLVFREREQSVGRELWRKLAATRAV
jgi:hypothetical protein